MTSENFNYHQLSLLFARLKKNITVSDLIVVTEEERPGGRQCALVSYGKHDTAYLFFFFF